MKTCYKCNISKTPEEFGPNRYQVDGLQTYCKNCRRPYMRKRYTEKKDYLTEQGAKRKFNLRMKIFERIGKKCVTCGNTNLYHLQIEHKYDDGKTDRISLHTSKVLRQYLLGHKNITRLQPMCSNCNIEKQLRKYKHLPKFIEEYNAKFKL